MTPASAASPTDQSAVSPASRPSGGLSLSALWTLYVLSFRQHVHGRRWMVMAALFLLPMALAILIRAVSPNVPPVALEFLLAFMFIPQALLPLVALVYASGIIQDEQEEQTLTYLLIRPLPKWTIYAVKLLATLTTTVSLTTLFSVLTYAAIFIGGDTSFSTVAPRCLKTVGIHGLAVIAYCCLFGFMSLLTKRTLIAGIIYAALVEGLLANLPFGIRLITIIYYTRLIAYRTLDFVVTVPHGTENIAAASWQFDIRNDPDLLAHPTMRTCVVVLAASSALLSAVAAFLCAQREFRVKTPSGN